MTATATAAPDAPLVSAPEASTLFMSRRVDLRLVKEARYPQLDPRGRQIGVERGQVLFFRDGVLRVPHAGELELEDGGKISGIEAVEWLESHRLIGDLQGGFWRVDPTAPPISREELDGLLEMTMELDVDKLQAFIDQERAGWGREDLIETAEKSLERVLEVHARAAAPSTGA